MDGQISGMIREAKRNIDVGVEVLSDNGEFLRATVYPGDRSTVVAGCIAGVTFSLQAPEELPDDAITRMAAEVVTTIRDNAVLLALT